MTPIAFDTETAPILPGLLAPPLACVSVSTGDLYGVKDAERAVRSLLLDDSILLVGANIAYDMAVLSVEYPNLLPLVFDKYEKNLVSDVQIRQMLLDIQAGEWRTKTDAEGVVSRTGYSLADLAKSRLGIEMDKTTWRMGYGKLRDVPLKEWPMGAAEYAIGDAKTTLQVWESQNVGCPCWGEKEEHVCNLAGEAFQVRAAFALHLMSCWGLRTDAAAVKTLKDDLASKALSFKDVLSKAGLVRPNGTKDSKAIQDRLLAAENRDFAIGAEMEMAAMAYAQSGKNPPEYGIALVQERVFFHTERTPKGKVKTDADSLKRSGDPVLETLAEAGGVQKLLTTYVPVLEHGTVVPIQSRYHVLARSGRTSCSSPNMQNLPKEPGVRECFFARPGFSYAFCDYSILELRCLAQVLLHVVGWSKMAEALQNGRELHLSLAAQIIGISYEEAVERKGDKDVKDARQLAKVGNFGFPGGMGPEKLVDFARASYGLRLTVEQCERLRSDWFSAFPEMREYFQWVSREIGSAGRNRMGSITQLGGRIRGGVGFTDGANTMFQGLGADVGKDACWEVARECYSVKESPLYGSRPVVFVHDELGLEVPEKKASEALARLETVMKDSMRKFLPDIPAEVSGLLSTVWSKEAERIEVDGKAIPWSPECS